MPQQTDFSGYARSWHSPAVCGGVDVLGKLKEIEKAPFRSPEEIREKQFQDLCALLAHAEARVPYYRTMFRRVGIRSQDIRTWGDFAHLPILTKDIIRENQRELVREDVPVEKLSPHFSGGSTGVPLKFFRKLGVHGRE